MNDFLTVNFFLDLTVNISDRKDEAYFYISHPGFYILDYGKLSRRLETSQGNFNEIFVFSFLF